MTQKCQTPESMLRRSATSSVCSRMNEDLSAIGSAVVANVYLHRGPTMPLKLIYHTKLHNNARKNFLNKRKKLIGVAKNAPAPLGRRLMCFDSKLIDCFLV